MTIKFVKKAFVFLFFFFIGIIYLHNLTRDIYSGDIGDLVTAAYVFGVAHPPGYPLFSFLGFVISHLPIPLPIVSKVGLISVFSSIAGLIIYYKFCLKVSKSLFIALLSTSILAFSYLFWLTAEIPEGLGLNNFFVIVIIYFAIRFYEKQKAKDLYLLALFTGLSITHQMFIFTLFPAIFILLIKHYRFIFSKKRFLFAFLWFLAGLSIYIYIPIAASGNPPINWNNAVNLKNFFHLVLRRDYGGVSNMLKNIPIEIRMIHILHYLKTVVSVFSYQILLVVVLGALKIFKVDKKIFLSILLAFLSTGILSFFYIAEPIFSETAWGVSERYYSVSIIVLMFTVPYGFLLIKDFLNSKFSKPIYGYLLLSYFLIVPIMMFQYNYPKTDLSKTNIGNNLARNILISLPKNAVLFISGDNATFTVWYVHYVLKERRDIDIINQPGVGNDIYINKEINDYYLKNPKVDLKDVMANTLVEIRKKRPLYSTGGTVPLSKDDILLPKGLVFEIIKKNDLPDKEDYLAEIENIWKKIKIIRRKDLTLAEENFVASEMPLFYSRAMTNIGNFLYNYYNDPKKAEVYYNRAIFIDDTNSVAYSGLALSIFKNDKNCDLALKNIEYAISLYPVWSQYYDQQYYLAKNCQIGRQALDNLKLEYRLRFNQEIKE